MTYQYDQKTSAVSPLIRLKMLLALAICMSMASCGVDEYQETLQENLQENLQARLVTGEFGVPNCAPTTSNLRPVDQGFDDILFEAIPGAHRVVMVPDLSGWRMELGVPELLVAAQAGFYNLKETSFVASDGIERPAREFSLTPKGFLAMDRPGSQCFVYLTYGSIELISTEEVEAPERLLGYGKAYRVKFKLRHAEPKKWAQTPEFHYVFNNILNVGRNNARGALRERLMIHSKGRWLTEREATKIVAQDTAVLENPRMREQVERQRAKMESGTAERKAARVAKLPADILKKLYQESYHEQLAPCLQLPLRGADLTTGLWKKDGPPSWVFYDDKLRNNKARYEQTIEFIHRFETVGLVKAEPFDGEPFAGARKGAGTRYFLSKDAAGALDSIRTGCLHLGDAALEKVQVGVDLQNVAFLGWARLVHPRVWTALLSKQFPSVQSIVKQGYGFSGQMPVADGEMIRVKLHSPAYGFKSPMRDFKLELPIIKTGPAFLDKLASGIVRMQGQGCSISKDGTEVSTLVSCSLASASRGFRQGRAYAEIEFHGKTRGAKPDTWTNAAVTSPRHFYSVSTGAASFSFAGSFTKHQIEDGDLIGIALDMDEQVLYWHLNGKWMTGRPRSGIGEPMIDTGQEYLIAVSVQNKTESWRVNFGATPFRFPLPEGFPPYMQ